MDAITLLTQDHNNVRELFDEVEKLGDRAKVARRALFDKIEEELTLHTKIEEKIFYPAFKERAHKGEERDEVLEAYEEHAVAKSLIRELARLDASDERYKAKLSVLIEAVKHHADEEEKIMFPMARKLFDASELDELGDKILSAKEKAGAPIPQLA